MFFTFRAKRSCQPVLACRSLRIAFQPNACYNYMQVLFSGFALWKGGGAYG